MGDSSCLSCWTACAVGNLYFVVHVNDTDWRSRSTLSGSNLLQNWTTSLRYQRWQYTDMSEDQARWEWEEPHGRVDGSFRRLGAIQASGHARHGFLGYSSRSYGTSAATLDDLPAYY